MEKRLRLIFTLLIAVGTLGSLCLAEADVVYGAEVETSPEQHEDSRCFLNENELLKEIAEVGAKKVVGRYYSKPKKWRALLEVIEGGSPGWLRIAVALADGADAGARDELRYAVAGAIKNNAQGVMKIALPKYGSEKLCGEVDIDSNKYRTYESVVNELQAQKKSLEALDAERYRTAKKECLESIDRKLPQYRKWFGR
jgi:hypothetical protein